jgi:hygromycin-B 7''-O-kinase
LRCGTILSTGNVAHVPSLPAPPEFASAEEFQGKVADAAFWNPYVRWILTRHGRAADDIDSGTFGTSPTFLAGDVVVKLFGGTSSWQLDYDTEHVTHELLSAHPGVPAPALLAHGRLYDDPVSWPYLVLQRLNGRPWHDVALSPVDEARLAHQLGGIIRRVHEISLPAGREQGRGRLGRDWLAEHAQQCVDRLRAWGTLPPHLLDQVGEYVLPPLLKPRLVHADLAIDHIFVTESADVCLAGIIDWGGAEATDRHYELPILHFDAFRGELALLQAFLDGYGWKADHDFTRRAMSAALQHESDVVENLLSVQTRIRLEDFDNLDALASACWAAPGDV